MKKKGWIILIIILIVCIGLGIGLYFLSCEEIRYSCIDNCGMYSEDENCVPCPKPIRSCSFSNLFQ